MQAFAFVDSKYCMSETKVIRMNKITIKDVAKEADVSPSTVSRVISDSPNISEPTKDKVRFIMEEMGYFPNAIARSLVKQKTRSIGLVMSRPTDRALANPFFSGVIQGIAAVAQEKNYSLLLTAADNYEDEYQEALKQLKVGKVDGLVLLASRINDDLIKQLLENSYPFVLIGRSEEFQSIPRVDNDNYKAAYSLVERLIHSGYKEFSILAGHKDYVFTGDRLKGVIDALKAYNLELNQDKIEFTDFTFESAEKSAYKILSNHKVDVLIAFDDLLGMAAVQTAEILGFSIPDQIGIVGFNDHTLVSYLKPALTTVKIPIVEMGQKAISMLIKMLEETSYNGEEKIIPTEIIERESLKFK